MLLFHCIDNLNLLLNLLLPIFELGEMLTCILELLLFVEALLLDLFQLLLERGQQVVIEALLDSINDGVLIGYDLIK